MDRNPVRRVEASAGSHAMDANAYRQGPYREQKREEKRRFGWNWPAEAKNHLIAKIKQVFWPQLAQANAQAQFPKPTFELKQTAEQIRATIKSAEPAKKQLPQPVKDAVQRIQSQDWDTTK